MYSSPKLDNLVVQEQRVTSWYSYIFYVPCHLLWYYLVMGNYMNKLLFHTDDSRKESEAQTIEQQPEVPEEDKLCTPTCSGVKFLIDPRSASLGIKRTPIVVDGTPVGVNKRIPTAIPKHLLKKQYLETDLDTVLPWAPKKNFVEKLTVDVQSQVLREDKVQNSLTLDTNNLKTPKCLTAIEKERYKILGLDPRSPAADFNRTPILVPKSLAKLKARSQENLNRLGSYETDVYNQSNSWQETSVLLGNIEVHLPDIAAKCLKLIDSETLTELNTTNIRVKSDSDSDSDSSVFVSEENLTVIRNSRFKVSNDKSLVKYEQTITAIDKQEGSMHIQNNSEDVIKQNMQDTQVKNDNKIKIWHDLSMSEEVVAIKKNEEEVPKNIEENLSNECATKNGSVSKPTKMENNQKKEDVVENVKKVPKSDVKCKSEEKKTVTPENKYDNEAAKNRTPLGNRSNNGNSQGIPTKSPQQLLVNKTMSLKMQQENTPPCKNYNAKIRNGINWDPNSSVII